jgi:hypothetical protein
MNSHGLFLRPAAGGRWMSARTAAGPSSAFQVQEGGSSKALRVPHWTRLRIGQPSGASRISAERGPWSSPLELPAREPRPGFPRCEIVQRGAGGIVLHGFDRSQNLPIAEELAGGFNLEFLSDMIIMSREGAAGRCPALQIP